jgi:hypothetical protein
VLIGQLTYLLLRWFDIKLLSSSPTDFRQRLSALTMKNITEAQLIAKAYKAALPEELRWLMPTMSQNENSNNKLPMHKAGKRR